MQLLLDCYCAIFNEKNDVFMQQKIIEIQINCEAYFLILQKQYSINYFFINLYLNL